MENFSSVPPLQISEPIASNQHVQTTGSLPNFSTLLKTAWSILNDRPKTIFGITAILALPQCISTLISLAWASTVFGDSIGLPLLIPSLLIYIVVYLIVYIWGTVALLVAIKDREERIGIRESFRRARSMVFPWMWVSTLVSAAVLGGFLLLIIPGIIFGIWFGFAAIVLIVENIRGTEALRKSKGYVQGRSGEVFTNIFLLGLIYIPLYIGVGIISTLTSGLGVIGVLLHQIVSLIPVMIVVPLGMAFQFVLYEKLKALHGTVPEKKSNTAFIIVIVIVGFLVAIAVIGIIASVVLASLGGVREKVMDLQRKTDVQAISLSLGLYASDNNVYPENLNQLVPQELPSVPIDPTTHAPYDYEVSADAQSYEICATLAEASSTSFAYDHYCMSDSLVSTSTTATSTNSVNADSATLNPGR